jgi:hypothetical protein
MSVRELNVDDQDWAEAFLGALLGGRMQARMGEEIDVLSFPGFVVEVDGRPVAILTPMKVRPSKSSPSAPSYRVAAER